MHSLMARCRIKWLFAGRPWISWLMKVLKVNHLMGGKSDESSDLNSEVKGITFGLFAWNKSNQQPQRLETVKLEIKTAGQETRLG